MTNTFPSSDSMALSLTDRGKLVLDLYHFQTGQTTPIAAGFLLFAAVLSFLLSIVYLAFEFLMLPRVNPKLWFIFLVLAMAFGFARAYVVESNRKKQICRALGRADFGELSDDAVLDRLDKADDQTLQILHKNLKPMSVTRSYAVNAIFIVGAIVGAFVFAGAAVVIFQPRF